MTSKLNIFFWPSQDKDYKSITKTGSLLKESRSDWLSFLVLKVQHQVRHWCRTSMQPVKCLDMWYAHTYLVKPGLGRSGNLHLYIGNQMERWDWFSTLCRIDPMNCYTGRRSIPLSMLSQFFQCHSTNTKFTCIFYSVCQSSALKLKVNMKFWCLRWPQNLELVHVSQCVEFLQ